MAEDVPSDEELRELWERILTTRTEEAFRDFVFDRVAFRPGESVLSAGCGPGFETAALTQHVGQHGDVTGIDVNESVLAAARNRCDDLPQVSFMQGDINDLPVADESYDLAIAKQVLSEIPDVDSALTELFRVVKPGGRVAVTAGDRRTHAKHTSTDRMQRADEIFKSVTSGRQLGTRLRSSLPDVGLAVESITPYTKIQDEINAQVERGIERQRRILAASDEFADSEIDAWERDMRDLDEASQFLSCGTSFLYVARKPE